MASSSSRRCPPPPLPPPPPPPPPPYFTPPSYHNRAPSTDAPSAPLDTVILDGRSYWIGTAVSAPYLEDYTLDDICDSLSSPHRPTLSQPSQLSPPYTPPYGSQNPLYIPAWRPSGGNSSTMTPPAARRGSQTSPASATRGKKRRRSHDSPPEAIEEIDLVAPDPVEALREKERRDLVAQQKRECEAQQNTSLADMTCIICMDNYTNLTITICGHAFCHECLDHALYASDAILQTDPRLQGKCPVCRKTIRRSVKSSTIPLTLMTKSAYEKKQRRP